MVEDTKDERRGEVWGMKPRPARGLRRARGRKRSKGVCEDRSGDCICRYGIELFCINVREIIRLEILE